MRRSTRTLCPVWNRARTQQITNLLDWCRFAPPASKDHWVPGASAMETARSWLSGDSVPALRELLDNSQRPELADLKLAFAIAEAQTRFDRWPGGVRNHDVLATGRTATGSIVLGIEGKVNEPFGDKTVSGYLDAARRLIASGKHTNRVRRMTELAAGVAGCSVDDPRIGGLRYQLFSAVAGTLAAARGGGAARGVLVLHEFITPRTIPARQAANRRDLSTFVGAVFGSAWADQLHEGCWLVGPLTVPGGGQPWGDRELWIGHLRTKALDFDLQPAQWDCFAASGDAARRRVHATP